AENAEIKDASSSSSSSSSSSGSTTITPVEGDTDTHVIVINSAGQRGRIPRANLEAALASSQYRRPESCHRILVSRQLVKMMILALRNLVLNLFLKLKDRSQN